MIYNLEGEQFRPIELTETKGPLCFSIVNPFLLIQHPSKRILRKMRFT